MGIEIRALAISILLAAALYFTYGQFVLEWITVLPVVLALVLFSLPTPRWFLRSRKLLSLLTILGFLAVAAFSLLPEEGGWLRSMIVDVGDQTPLPAMRILFGLAGVSTVALFFTASRKWSIAVFGVVLAFMIGSYALIMSASPRAQIDVWTVHEEGAQAFVDGKNPYTIEYTNIYPPELRPTLTPGGVTFSYMPGVFMWMSPWKALGLDTRYSQLVTRLFTAILLLLIARAASARRDFMTYVPALLFITFPLNTFFIVRAWNDDISMMCYALAGYGMISRRPWALFVATNFLLLHKQHAIFFVPILIWFAWREWRDKWAWLKATIVAALVCGGYLIADWRNFLGSLYGLTFLKFPNIHTVFLERRDPFSLMNYLHLFTGFKSSFFFLAVLAVMAFFILRKNWRQPDPASLLRGIGAMGLTLFIFAPIAFANYYQFALGLILIGYAATRPLPPEGHREDLAEGWEPQTNWWVIGYIASRAVILFNFSSLIVETRPLREFLEANRIPSMNPLVSAPAYIAERLSHRGDLNDFLAFHTLFQLAMVLCDGFIGWCVLNRAMSGRTSKLALALFVFGPLLIGGFWNSGPTLASCAFVWLLILIFERTTSRRTKRALLPEKFDWQQEALVVLAGGSFVAVCFWLADLAGFEVDFNPLQTPTHMLIWILTLLPLCPPLRPVSIRRVTFPAFAVALLAALAVSTFCFFNYEVIYSHLPDYVWLLNVRLGLIGLSAILLALSLKRGRTT